MNLKKPKKKNKIKIKLKLKYVLNYLLYFIMRTHFVCSFLNQFEMLNKFLSFKPHKSERKSVKKRNTRKRTKKKKT